MLIEHGDQSAEVDAAIAHLVLALWRGGIVTVASCEDFEGWGQVWVVFATEADAKRFIAAGRGRSGWPEIKSFVITAADVAKAEKVGDFAAGTILFCVFFPRRDLRAIRARIQKCFPLAATA